MTSTLMVLASSNMLIIPHYQIIYKLPIQIIYISNPNFSHKVQILRTTWLSNNQMQHVWNGMLDIPLNVGSFPWISLID